MAQTITLGLEDARRFARDILQKNGLAPAHAEPLARSMARAEADECRSHGLYRLIMCVNTLKGTTLDPAAEPVIRDETASLVIADAQNGFSLLAFERALPLLAEKARTTGMAALAIRNCHHFSALWPEVEDIAALGLVGLATNPSHAWVAPYGGKRPVLGTNPLAFGWPRPGRNPFVFDFATSAMARGDLELHLSANKPLPPGTALDAMGEPTTDAAAAMEGMMLPFGGHKGFALSLMIELIAGPLIGDLTSRESLARDGGTLGAPLHGELILAVDPARLSGGDAVAQAARAEALFAEISAQGARLPSERRYAARARTAETGTVTLDRALYDRLAALA